MGAPSYIQTLKHGRFDRSKLAADIHLDYIDRAARDAGRTEWRPSCFCPAVGRNILMEACDSRKSVRHLVPAIAAGCEGCKRAKA